MGERGVRHCHGERVERLAALPVERAGETTGAFAAALAEGQPAVEALRFGCGGRPVGLRRGAAAAMPSRVGIGTALAR